MPLDPSASGVTPITFTAPLQRLWPAYTAPSILISFLSGVFFAMWFRHKTAALHFGPSSAAGAITQSVKNMASFAQIGETKMVLVVRKDLKMSTGKICAQCSHAAVGIIEEVMALRSESNNNETIQSWLTWHDAWKGSGSPKVVLQCASEDELIAIYKEAKKQQLPRIVIRDAGRTQIEAGSKTVVAVGPAPKAKVDVVTGHLKLL